ncbi:MAG: mannose-1-phosphate guanylyltransferase [Planctomycetes bacterium]|nr:mannose-1-phosphate guanylyltransferase [Planctomycetota bacterium]
MPLDPERIIALVMAGGGGTRFWPRSRRARPKQFLAFDGEGSLLARTVARLDGLVPRDRVLIITGSEHVDLACAEAGVPRENVIGEPFGRDTAPCIGVGTLAARALREDAVVVVLAADHLISPEAAFRESIQRAAALAADSGSIVTMGLRPDRPATGYGYIEVGERVDDEEPTAHKVVRFREKPDLETARRFVLDGSYLWNSGNLAFSAQTMLDAIAEHLPELHAQLSNLGDPRSADELAEIYPDIEGISIDYGVLEHAEGRLCVEARYQWDDLGTFEAVARHAEKHGDGNLGRGDAMFLGCTGVLVDNDAEGLVVVQGLDDVLVVRTGDAVLVMPRSQAENVKDVVRELESRGHEDRL